MMEGVYFFGEHLRWNLGWNNPNQAGVFVAMWIPWLWALGVWVKGSWIDVGAEGSCRALRRGTAASVVLAVELGFWFLLCKTYSRGALVAVVVAGLAFLLWSFWRERRCSSIAWLAARLAGIGLLLWSTGFFSRIDPRFVSQDASAGNRLVLWKGGLQMIAESPGTGWGAGRSGNGFVHWFQPLDATERYAGMVNSYLHVGVEYGLPMLLGVIIVAIWIYFLAWTTDGTAGSAKHLPRAAGIFMMGAGCSWLVFLIANVFSTLWIFGNLWWMPAINGVLILVMEWLVGKPGFAVMGRGLGLAALIALLVVGGLYFIGRSIPGNPRVACHSGDRVMVTGEGSNEGQVLFFPEASVLGDDWGKEVRRLATCNDFRGMMILAPRTDSGVEVAGGDPKPRVIISRGGQFRNGFAALLKFPDAHLIVVHPVGKPVIPAGVTGRVSVILPAIDTLNSGRGWKAACKRMGWALSASPGVGQDIRTLWPGILSKATGPPLVAGSETPGGF